MTGAAEDIVAWTVGAGLEGLDQAELVAGYCERLTLAGVPLWRASIGADTLHPLIVAQGHRWLAGEGVEEEFYARSSNPEADQEWHSAREVEADYERERESWMRQPPAYQPQHYPAGYGHHGHYKKKKKFSDLFDIFD